MLATYHAYTVIAVLSITALGFIFKRKSHVHASCDCTIAEARLRCNNQLAIFNVHKPETKKSRWIDPECSVHEYSVTIKGNGEITMYPVGGPTVNMLHAYWGDRLLWFHSSKRFGTRATEGPKAHVEYVYVNAELSQAQYVENQMFLRRALNSRNVGNKPLNAETHASFFEEQYYRSAWLRFYFWKFHPNPLIRSSWYFSLTAALHGYFNFNLLIILNLLLHLVLILLVIYSLYKY